MLPRLHTGHEVCRAARVCTVKVKVGEPPSCGVDCSVLRTGASTFLFSEARTYFQTCGSWHLCVCSVLRGPQPPNGSGAEGVASTDDGAALPGGYHICSDESFGTVNTKVEPSPPHRIYAAPASKGTPPFSIFQNSKLPFIHVFQGSYLCAQFVAPAAEWIGK